MIPLKQVRIQTPCSADWEGMEGDAQTRFCTGCRKHVHHLSAMSRAEAEALLARAGDGVCVRFTPKADGTPRTHEHTPTRPLGARRVVAAALAVAVGVLNAGCGVVPVPPGLRAFVSRLSPSPPVTTMGAPLALPPPPPPVTTVLMGAPRAVSPPKSPPRHSARTHQKHHHRGAAK